MLANGFHMGETKINRPHSLNVAVQLTVGIVSGISSSQYGGTSLPNIDTVLAPYAEMDYNRHLKNAHEFSIPDAEEYAWKLAKHDIYEAMQGLEYGINTINSTSGQTPFTTVSFGLGADRFSREIQKSILDIRTKGLDGGQTAIFPKLVFYITKGINYSEQDPNYDIKKLALKCSSLRDYPDIVFTDNILKITGAKDVPMTSMGK